MNAVNWILVANAAHARLLQAEEGRQLVVLRTFEHPQSRLRTSQLAPDEAGRELGSRSFGGVTFAPRLDAQHREHLHFARELAAVLEEGALEGRYAALAIFASSPFLGLLKQHLGEATRRLLAEKYDLDLTSVGLAELARRIERARSPQP